MVIQKPWNCTPYKDNGKRHTYIYRKGILLKVCHVVTIWLQLSGSLDSEKSPCYNGGTVKERIVTSEKVAVCQKLAVRTLKTEYPFLGKDTILAKYAKMAKAGACQKMETLAVVAKEQYPKTGILFFTVNGKGEIICYMIPLYQHLDF